MKSQKIVVVGQGYVGLPLAMLAAESNYEVVGVDTDERKVGLLNSGQSFVEDVSNAELQRHLSNGRYVARSSFEDIGAVEVAVVSVPTPLKNGVPDLDFIESAGRSLSPHLEVGSTVILESTTYPGTTEELFRPALESRTGLRAGNDFFLGYSPERLDPGNPKYKLQNTTKIVSGIDIASLEKLADFFASLGIPVFRVSGTREAEMAKLLENTFRHVNIALVNELAIFSEQLGVDIWESISAADTKPFGYMKFLPGPGVGGHCLPVDPSYLSWAIREKTGENFRFVELANTVNQGMASYVVERSRRLLGDPDFAEKNVVIIGLAYKANTGDVRESPAIRIAEVLAREGAKVFGYDPHVRKELWPELIRRVDTLAAEDFDLGILVTHHESLDLGGWASSGTPLLDTRNSSKGSYASIL